MSTKAFGYVNEELKEIEEKYNKSKKRMEEIKEAKRQKTKDSEKRAMKNITINIPDNYDENIQKLIKLKIHASRSEAIRTALREFLNQEYGENLELLGFSDY